MPTPFEILVQMRQNVSQEAPKVVSGLDAIDNASKKAGQSFEQAGAKSENYGRMLARGVHVAQSSLDILAPSIGKIAPQFDSAIRAAQQFGGAMSLAFSYGPQGAALAALTAVIGLAINKIAEARQVVEQVKVPFEELKKTLAGLGPAVDPLAAALQKVLGVTAQVAAEMSYGARANEEYRRSLQAIVAVSEAVAAAEARRAQAAGRASELQRMGGYSPGQAAGYQQAVDQAHELDVTMLETSRSVRQLAAELPNLQAQARATADAEGVWLAQQTNVAAQTKQTTDEVKKQTEALAAFNAMLAGQEMARGAAVAKQFQTEWESMARLPSEQMREAGEKWIGDNKAAASAWAAKVEADAKAVIATIKGMVGKAIAPTFPTPEEMQIAGAGKPTPTHWDELARQAEDVALRPGTIEKYGDLQKALQETGMSADQFAKSFRDMTLFADPKNIKFAELDVVVANVKGQIQQLIGQANLAKAAFEEVWASMSGGERAQLAEALGVDASDTKAVRDALTVGADPKAKESAKTTDEIAKNIQIIAGIHVAIIDLQKSSTFDANLAEVLDDISQIPASADIVVTMTYQTVGVPAEEGGIAQPPAPTGPGVPMQHGGSFVVPPGFDENYPIRLSSGEQVTVLPANMSDADLDYFIKQNFATLERLYNANPQYWMGIAASHPGWGKRDWYEFIFGNQWGHFKLSDLGIPPAGGGKPTTSRPGDTFHGTVFQGPVYNSFTVYPRDYESLMRDARAAAAHGA